MVLPGLDRALDEASWDALEDSHPQASLRALLAALQVRREDVQDWAEMAPAATPVCPEGRVATWRTALLPAVSLSAWQDGKVPETGGLELLEAADQQEEALAIALVLREALAEPGARAALVTPDRQLAVRVAAELLRFGVVADDSAGEPLAETPAAVFLRLLAGAVAEDLRPVPLLALLKHPLCAAGLAPAACRQAARQLERDCLRGARPGPGLAGLRARGGHEGFLGRLAGCLAPLLGLRDAPAIPPDAALTALLQSAEALAASDTAQRPGAAVGRRGWRGAGPASDRAAGRAADAAAAAPARAAGLSGSGAAGCGRAQPPQPARPRGRRAPARVHLGPAGSAAADRRDDGARRPDRGRVAGRGRTPGRG